MKKRGIPGPKSSAEETFALHCRVYRLEPVREFQFCERKWRFDFAWPQFKIALEIEGGVSIRLESGQRIPGRHTTREGYTNDCEKYNEATRRGWRVFRYTSGMINDMVAIDQMRALIKEEGLNAATRASLQES